MSENDFCTAAGTPPRYNEIKKRKLKEMKKEYIDVKLDIVFFEGQDVVTASEEFDTSHDDVYDF